MMPTPAERNGAGRVFRRDNRVEYRPLADEGGVLLHLDTAAYHGLNELGARIWELLDGVTVAELVSRLSECFDEVPPSLAEDTAKFLSQLTERGLIVAEGNG